MVPWHYSEWYHLRFALLLLSSNYFVFAFDCQINAQTQITIHPQRILLKEQAEKQS